MVESDIESEQDGTVVPDGTVETGIRCSRCHRCFKLTKYRIHLRRKTRCKPIDNELELYEAFLADVKHYFAKYEEDQNPRFRKRVDNLLGDLQLLHDRLIEYVDDFPYKDRIGELIDHARSELH